MTARSWVVVRGWMPQDVLPIAEADAELEGIARVDSVPAPRTRKPKRVLPAVHARAREAWTPPAPPAPMLSPDKLTCPGASVSYYKLPPGSL